MAYDIGPRIGIDGESEFRRSIQNINANIKALGSEMKVVTESFADNADGMEALAAKTGVLEKSYEQQAKHLDEVQKMLDRAKDKFGENATETLKWQRVVNESTAALKKTENELKDTRQAMDKLENSTEDAEDAFEDLGDAAEKSGKGMSAMTVAAGNLISGGISKIAEVVGDVAREIYNLDEATEEYREAQGKLQTAFEAGGYNVETAKNAYTELYKIMGDTDSATEAAQLMAKLSESEADFAKWTEIAAGVAGTFGDALPIEGLIEAANETAKTGKVTGSLADALNWAGISEDEFNKSLEAAGSESERNRIIMETLTGAYNEASDAFYRNNEELIKSRENQAALDEVMGRLGGTVAEVKNEFMNRFGPAIAEIGNDIADFIEGVDTDKLFDKFDDAFTMIKDVWDFADDYFDEVAGLLEHSFDAIAGLWKGDFEQAADGIFGVMENIKSGVQEAINDIKNSWLFDNTNKIVQMSTGYNGATAEQMARDGYGGTYTTDYTRTNASGLTPENTAIYMDGKKVGSVVKNTQDAALAAAGQMPLIFR